MEITQMALELLQVDKLGLDHIDHKLLLGIIEKFRGGPVGLETVSATIEKNLIRLKMCMSRIYYKLAFTTNAKGPNCNAACV